MAPAPQQGVLPLDVPTKADDIDYIIEWVAKAGLDPVEHERRYSMTKPAPVTQRRDHPKLKRIARAKPKPGKKD